MPTEFSSTIVDDSGDVHGQVTLAIGSAGAPVIAYTSQSGEVRLAEQIDIDGEWIITKPPCGRATRDDYRISLDLGSRSEPHIALVNASTDHLVYGARGQQWTFEEVPTEGLSAGRVRFPSMKLYKGFHELRDQFGRTPFESSPYICYQAAQGILELRYAAKLRPRDNPAAEPVWKKHVDTIDRGDPEFGRFTALDISPDDIIRIAYYADLTRLGFNKRLHLASMLNDPDIPDRPIRRGEEGWHRETLDGVAAEIFGEPPSLAVLISDGGAVSYVSRTGQMPRSLKLCIFENIPESPTVELVTHNVDVGGSSVARSLSGKWCVAYDFNGRLMFATRTAPGAFAIENVEAGGGWPSMRFSDDGSAKIAHVAGGTLQFVVATPDD